MFHHEVYMSSETWAPKNTNEANTKIDLLQLRVFCIFLEYVICIVFRHLHAVGNVCSIFVCLISSVALFSSFFHRFLFVCIFFPAFFCTCLFWLHFLSFFSSPRFLEQTVQLQMQVTRVCDPIWLWLMQSRNGWTKSMTFASRMCCCLWLRWASIYLVTTSLAHWQLVASPLSHCHCRLHSWSFASQMDCFEASCGFSNSSLGKIAWCHFLGFCPSSAAATGNRFAPWFFLSYPRKQHTATVSVSILKLSRYPSLTSHLSLFNSATNIFWSLGLYDLMLFECLDLTLLGSSVLAYMFNRWVVVPPGFLKLKLMSLLMSPIWPTETGCIETPKAKNRWMGSQYHRWLTEVIRWTWRPWMIWLNP